MMKELVSKSKGFTRIEFWAASTIVVFLLFGYLTNGLGVSDSPDSTDYETYFDQAGVPFYFYYHYFIPQLVRNIIMCAGFLYINFVLVPNLLTKKNVRRNIFLLLAVFLLTWMIFGVTDTYLKGYLYTGKVLSDDVHSELFVSNFIFALRFFGSIAMYTVIKYCAIYLITNAANIYARYRFFTIEGIVAFAVWFIILFLLVLFGTDAEVVLGWVFFVLAAILLYLFSFYRLIPKSLGKKYPFVSYALRCLLVLFIAFFPFTLIFTGIFDSGDMGVTISFLNTLLQLFVTVPVTWVVYKRKMKGNEELLFLRKELKQTSANIDFLRSQINPHFLFNALNTLYGTALQENAERTGEGIQKLGDMMRFMLQENMQEKISLSREIEYLNNYINLQRLRTDPDPNIRIQTAIQDAEVNYQVAPMLLIPFVENAFKHGISFREPSHIKVTLEIKDKTLYFDVYNSRHPRTENDPERDKAGIGLENVKHRLKLLYPNKHELMIRETGKEFFIHLTIQLG